MKGAEVVEGSEYPADFRLFLNSREHRNYALKLF